MRPQYFPQGRAERLIAAGRLILATFSLLAIWLDPSEPAKYAQNAYGLLVGYIIYALLLALWAWYANALSVRLRILSHAADLILFSLFYFAEASSNPFFVDCIFSLVSAKDRTSIL